MIEKSKAIVLHHLKYSETSIIVTMYTEAFGRQSYIINGIRSAKSKQKMGLLQPLFLLAIEAYHKPNRDVQRMKEFKLDNVYHELPFNVVKSTISMFLAEVLSKVLQSHEPDSRLFNFLYHSFLYFDIIEKGVANFHLWFLIQLLSYSGFKLENNYSHGNSWFDMKAGNFTVIRPTFPNTPTQEESLLISELIKLDIEKIQDFQISGDVRTRLLELLVEYYTIHFDAINSINSLAVLQEIFH